MKILFVCELQQLHSRRYISYFVERDHEVHVITPVPPDPAPIPGAVVHCLPRILNPGGLSKHKNYLQAIRTLSRIVKYVQPDLLNALFLTDYGFWSALCGFHPLAITPWGSDVLRHPYQKKLWKWMGTFALSCCDLLVCNSECMRRSAVETLGADENKIRAIVWNGVDTNFFSIAAATDVRATLGLNGKKVLFSNRTLEPNYRVDRIIDMFAILRTQMNETVLLIAGDGSQKAALMNKCRELGIDQSVRFMGKVIPEVVRDCLRACDLYLSVAESDSSATSVLEAMACGAQIMVSDSAANIEWIRHGENGWIVRPEDTQSFTGLSRKALSNPLGPPAIRENLAIVRRKASHQENMKALEESFHILAGNYKSPAREISIE